MIRLLIADDEISACNDMIRCINWDKYGIEIIGVAGDGPETYRMIQSCRPDIVLIDIQMPGMSGIEVIKQIRGAEEPHPSFIIVSGYDDFSYAQQAIELDVDQYLLKPFLPTQLLKAVHHSAEKLEIVRQRGAFLGFSELWQGDTISLSYPAKEERQVIRAIQSGSDEELDSALETFWAAASVSSANGNAMLFSIFLLSIAVLHLLFDCGVSQLPSPSLQPAAEGEESRLASLRRFAYAARAQLQNRRTEVSAPALRAAAYIAEHYREDLSLDAVAQAIYVSASYLSGCFPQTMGMGFVEYIHHTRIEHAKGLLLNTNLKIYQVAEQVGYRDHKYFSQIFKKLTKSSPGEYRTYTGRAVKTEGAVSARDKM